MARNNRKFICILFALSVGWLLIHSNFVAAQPEIDEARNYPPGSMNQQALDRHQLVIDWRIEQLQSLSTSYHNTRQEIAAEIQSTSQMVQNLASKLPGELRFTTKETRAHLVGRLVETMLDAKLELATREKEIEVLTSNLKDNKGGNQKGEKLEIMRAEVAVKTSEKKLLLTATMFEHTQKLFKDGFTSSEQREAARHSLELAELELERAKGELEILSNSKNAEIAVAVADRRIEVEPIKARINEATKLLASFTQAAETFAKIDSLRREVDLYEKDRMLVAGELSSISRELQELKMLKKNIKNRLESNLKKAEK